MNGPKQTINDRIRKMAMISKSVSLHSLETIATQYFSPEMVQDANDCIVSHSNALPLTDLFRRKEGFIMTGSDGQKYDVSVPALRASASYNRAAGAVEHSNKFSSAVMLGNHGSLGWATQRERDISSGCRMLIINAINYYNLLYLSEKLRQCKTDGDRGELLTTILKSSTHTCRTADAASHQSGRGIPLFGPEYASIQLRLKSINGTPSSPADSWWGTPQMTNYQGGLCRTIPQMHPMIAATVGAISESSGS